MNDPFRSLDLTLVLVMLACTPGRGPWLAHPVAARHTAALSDGHATSQRESSSPRTVTNAAELADAPRAGGAIPPARGRYVGNFVVSVDGTTFLGRTDLPDARVEPDAVAGVVLAPANPLTPTLQVTASRVNVTGLTVLNGAPDRETVVVGSATATDALQQPDDVTFDRVAVLAGESGG